ncbi:hypothetical protein HNR42_003141 [Deinobacterium chartae]|uniref:PD-(D/E)XK endonuclease-like domain-containing protein n=1 Tax=Deinobacterium chartae TaxID=521158 RepID=A0A841I322_9DEIO|nr:PD-(D/E)XK nuclease family protein [Deinobacterium chartae]MBB6099683.1 hypothetical protein [Deinobacterium chartae]
MNRLALTSPYPSALRDEAIRRASRHALLVIPNVQAGRSLRRAGQLSIHARTFTQLARQALQDTGWQPLRHSERDAAWYEALQDVSWRYLAPLQERSSTVESLRRLLDALWRANLEPAAVLNAAQGEREHDIAAAFAALDAHFRRTRRYDVACTEYYALRTAALTPRVLLAHGFGYLDATQVALLDRLAAPGSVITLPYEQGRFPWRQAERTLHDLTARGFCTETLNTIPANVGTRALRSYLEHNKQAPHAFLELPEVETEVRACLRWVRANLERGVHAAQIAVIVRDEHTYLPTLSDIAREYGLPLLSAARLPLTRTALGALLALWIRADRGGWRYPDTRAFLGHPLLALPDGLPEQGYTARRTRADGLDAWSPQLAWLALPQTESAHARLRHLERLLSDGGITARAARDPALNLALRALVDALKGLARRDDPLDAEAFRALLERTLTSTFIPALHGKGGVRVLNPLGAMGRSFEHLWLLGLSDTVFPMRRTDHPLLDAFSRTRWAQRGAPLPDAAQLSEIEEALFLNVIGTAHGELVLSRAQRDLAGRTLLPSPFLQRLGPAGNHPTEPPLGSALEHAQLQALAGQPDPQVLEAALIEELRDQGIPFTHHGQLEQPLSVDTYRWSPSQLHDLGACSYRWFARHLLALEEEGSGSPPEDRRLQGQLLHAALEGALADWDGTRDPDMLYARARVAFERCELRLRNHGELKPHPLWNLTRIELLRSVEQAVRSPSFLPEGWRPRHLELHLSTTIRLEGGNWTVYGVVDRVDDTPQGRAVTDYKRRRHLSRVAPTPGGPLELDLQLPLYLRALPATYGRYWSIERTETLAEAGAGVSRRGYDPQQHAQAVEAFLNNRARLLTSGVVTPLPDPRREACTFCGAAAVCRVRPGVSA